MHVTRYCKSSVYGPYLTDADTASLSISVLPINRSTSADPDDTVTCSCCPARSVFVARSPCAMVVMIYSCSCALPTGTTWRTCAPLGIGIGITSLRIGVGLRLADLGFDRRLLRAVVIQFVHARIERIGVDPLVQQAGGQVVIARPVITRRSEGQDGAAEPLPLPMRGSLPTAPDASGGTRRIRRRSQTRGR